LEKKDSEIPAAENEPRAINKDNPSVRSEKFESSKPFPLEEISRVARDPINPSMAIIKNTILTSLIRFMYWVPLVKKSQKFGT
jgi:hypothetical protein